jgi:hypothetical protein
MKQVEFVLKYAAGGRKPDQMPACATLPVGSIRCQAVAHWWGSQGGGTPQESQGSIPRQARCRLVVGLQAVRFKEPVSSRSVRNL